MLNWCDKNNVKYIIGLAKNSRLLKFSKELQDQAEASYEKTHDKVKLFAEFEYAAGTWKYPRRVIAKAEFNSLGPNNRFIVTNLDGNGQELTRRFTAPEAIWRIESRNSSLIFLRIGRAAMTLWQINFDFCFRVWHTFL